MTDTPDKDELLAQMNSFESDQRAAALSAILEHLPDRPEEKPWVNMHLHTFFSYNGEGHSPTRIAFEARQRGLYAVAICDFDVLSGLQEFIHATDQLGVRSMAGFETRALFQEYAAQEINSPGEPGVFYFMGTGFVKPPAQDSLAESGFQRLMSYARERNIALVERINEALSEVTVDYDQEVLPLTPAGNATERHIIQAYHNKAIAVCGGLNKAADFWAKVLGRESSMLREQIQSANDFTNMLRSDLVKQGGLAYQQPSPAAFPVLDDVIDMIKDQRAIPTSTWLDGTRAGEREPHEQLTCLMDKGIEAVNIIPDRNWNIDDPEERAQKIAELGRYIGTARTLGLPINVGTELNKPGQRFVDDFTSQPLKTFLPDMLEGARIMVGHTRFLRYADFSYTDEQARACYPDRRERNQAFAQVGALPAPDVYTQEKLGDMSAETAFNYIQDAARKGDWTK